MVFQVALFLLIFVHQLLYLSFNFYQPTWYLYNCLLVVLFSNLVNLYYIVLYTYLLSLALKSSTCNYKFLGWDSWIVLLWDRCFLNLEIDLVWWMMIMTMVKCKHIGMDSLFWLSLSLSFFIFFFTFCLCIFLHFLSFFMPKITQS